MDRLAKVVALSAGLMMAAGCGGGTGGGGDPPGPTTYAVSGTVSGAVTSGVTLVLGGGGSATVTSGGAGAYAFSGLGNGTYTVTPSLAGYTFSPSTIQVTVSGASVSGQDFTAAAEVDVQAALQGTWAACVEFGGASDRLTLTFSGTAMTAGMESFPGAACLGAGTPSGGGSGTFAVGPAVSAFLGGTQVSAHQLDTTTDQAFYDLVYVDAGASPPRLYLGDSSGFYDGTTPAKRPTSLDATTPFLRQAGPHTISGTVQGGAGVTLTLGGDASAITTAGATGDYAFRGLASGSYTVTPSHPDRAFTPGSLPVTVDGASVGGQDFTAAVAHSISGAVSGAVVAGIPVTLGGARSATTTTDATGAYRFSGLPDGAYYVGPSLAGYAFAPASLTVMLGGASVAGQDFTAAASAPCTAFAGSVEIRNPLDWQALLDRGCTSISGDLMIFDLGLAGPLTIPALRSVGGALTLLRCDAVTSLDLPDLTTAGVLMISVNAALSSVSLPSLATVDLDLNVSDTARLASLGLPALTSVGVNLRVQNNRSLASLGLPALASVGGGLAIDGNVAALGVDLPALASVGGLSLQDNAGLASFNLPSLSSAGGMIVATNAALSSFSLPALAAGGSLRLWYNPRLGTVELPLVGTFSGYLDFTGNAAATSLDLPALTAVGGSLSIDANSALTSFGLPALTSIGGQGLSVQVNPLLPQCLALAFKDHLVTAHGYAGPWTISGNDAAAPCPP